MKADKEQLLSNFVQKISERDAHKREKREHEGDVCMLYGSLFAARIITEPPKTKYLLLPNV